MEHGNPNHRRCVGVACVEQAQTRSCLREFQHSPLRSSANNPLDLIRCAAPIRPWRKMYRPLVGASGLHDSLANTRTTIKAQTVANTVSNIQNSELKSMPLSCSGRSNGGSQGGISGRSSFGSMIHLRCSARAPGLGAISMEAAILPRNLPSCDQKPAVAMW